MRILHVINQLEGGGAEASLRDILRALPQDEFEHGVAVLACQPRNASPRLDVPAQVYEPVAPLRSRRARVLHVYQAVKGYGPDLIHTTLFEADTAGRIVGKATRTPVLTSLVNTPYSFEARQATPVHPLKMRAVQLIDAFLARTATTAFHAITEAVAAAAASDLRVDPGKIKVVPRGRDAAHLGPPSQERRRRVRESLGVPPDTPMLLTVGREEPQKAHGDLLEAFALLQNVVPGALLVVAGRRGNSSALLDATVSRLALGDVVMRLGPRDDIGDLLTAADAFVFPSRYEGLGGAVLEAMAMGVPIVASDLPALREVLDDGACALLVPPARPSELARAMERVLADSEEARCLGARAQRRFRANYTLDSCAEGMASLYRSLAPQPR